MANELVLCEVRVVLWHSHAVDVALGGDHRDGLFDKGLDHVVRLVRCRACTDRDMRLTVFKAEQAVACEVADLYLWILLLEFHHHRREHRRERRERRHSQIARHTIPVPL